MTDEIPDFVNLCSVYDYPEDQQLGDSIPGFLELTYPEFLPNTDSYIDLSNPEDFHIIKSTGNPEPPSRGLGRSVFELEAKIEPWKAFHVHSYIQKSHYDDLVEFHNLFTEMDGELQVNHSSVSIQLPFNIEEARFEIAYDFDASVQGIELQRENAQFSIFREEPEGPFLSVTNFESEESTEDIENHINATKTMATEFLEAIHP